MTSFRADRAAALAPLAAPKTAVHFEGRVARVHTPEDPLQYSSGPEYRRADELQRIVDQLPGTKVTMLHPQGLLSQGAEARIIGVVVSARIDGEFAVAVVALDDETAIQEVREGVQELSLGYTCNLDADRYQVGITIDHLSIVPAARCGQDCALRVDTTADLGKTPNSVEIEIRNLASTTAANNLEAQFDGTACSGHDTCTCKRRANCYAASQMDELKTQLIAAIAEAAAEKARADAAEKRAGEEKSRADAADARATQAEIDRDNAKREMAAEQARVDAAVAEAKAEAEKARADAALATAGAVAARVKLLTEANRVLGDEDRGAMSDRDIKAAVIKHVDGEDVPADKPEMYVDGIYDGALKRHAKGAGSRADALVAINEMRKDGVAAVAAAADPMAREKAAAAALKRSLSTAWQQKTPQE